MEQAKVREKPFLALERRYPVAPEKVWRAWTDPKALGQWFRPDRGTQLELRHEGYLDFDNQPTHEQGWNGALDKLGQLLQER